jgi:hypothetical protein
MQLDHPQFPGLKIVTGEKAQAGAWYVPTSGQTLSHIANQAYGVGALPMVLKIDKSLWNRANLIYRKTSANCYSQQVDSGLALSQSSFAAGAWIALCQQDTPSWAVAMGFNFPPVWLPPAGTDEQPGDLVGGGGPGYQFQPVVPGPADDSRLAPPGGPQPEQQPKGGFKWWHGALIGGSIVVVGGIVWAASDRKKK